MARILEELALPTESTCSRGRPGALREASLLVRAIPRVQRGRATWRAPKGVCVTQPPVREASGGGDQRLVWLDCSGDRP